MRAAVYGAYLLVECPTRRHRSWQNSPEGLAHAEERMRDVAEALNGVFAG